MTAHRALIVRKLKGLEDIIPYTSVHWEMLEKGWRFATSEDNEPGEHVEPDPIHKGFTHLRDVYFDVNKDYEGRFTVPTLYDTKQKTIVSNESSEIIRMFYTEFDHLLDDKYKNVVLLPEDLKPKIEETNEWTYNDINNGVYKSGFATYALLRITFQFCTNIRTAPKKPTRRPSRNSSSLLIVPKQTSPSPAVLSTSATASQSKTSVSTQQSSALTPFTCSTSSATSVTSEADTQTFTSKLI